MLNRISDVSDSAMAWRNMLSVAVALPKDRFATVAVRAGEMLRLSIKNTFAESSIGAESLMTTETLSVIQTSHIEK